MRIKIAILLLFTCFEASSQYSYWLIAKDGNFADTLCIKNFTDSIFRKNNNTYTFVEVAKIKPLGGPVLLVNNLLDATSAATARDNIQIGEADNTSDADKPISTAAQTALNTKQATLVSGTNIKTVNGGSVLGSGDLVVAGGTAPVYSRVTGSNVTTTGQALVNITGLSNALAINAVYEFEAVLSVSTSAVTTGTAYGVNYSVAGGTVEAHITGSSTSTASKTLRISALNTATTLYLATSAQTGGIRIKGIITTGANAGNLTIQHLKLTSGTSTVFINSYLKTTRIL